jgi:N-acetylmuramoyl-L-alanine amidase
VRYVTREAWGGLPAERVAYLDPARVDRIFIHHTTGEQQDDKAAWLRSIQRFHMQTRGWSDIAYSLLVDAQGVAYVGRGFGRVGAHTKGYNSTSVAIAYLGSGLKPVPEAALHGIRRAVEDARLWFGRDLPVFGHCDVGSTTCPGPALLAWVREGMPVADPLPPSQLQPLSLHPDDPLRDRTDAPPHLLWQGAVRRGVSAPEPPHVDIPTVAGSAERQDGADPVAPVPGLRDGWRRHLDRMRRRRG